MPFTGSHPAAVLPLKRWCSQTPYFAALVIGSMSPDFGYFSPIDINMRYSHTFEGALIMDIPISMIALLVVLIARKSFCELLPNPHRDFLLSLCVKPNVSWKMIFMTALCLFFGAWTHVVWDSFTHGLSPLVRQSDWLKKEPWLGMPVYRIIQHASTLLGGFILFIAYQRALKKKDYRFWPKREAKEFKRFALWFGLGVVSLIASFVKNYFRLESAKAFYDYQVYAFHFVVSSLVFYFSLLILLWLCSLQPRFRLWLNR